MFPIYSEILWSGDPQAIQRLVSELFAFAVPLPIVEVWIEKLNRDPERSWSNQSVKTWLKLRLDEFYPFPAGQREVPEVRFVTELHFFSIWWPCEFKQELPAAAGLDGEEPAPAKSRLTSDLAEIVQPIDSTASRVVTGA